MSFEFCEQAGVMYHNGVVTSGFLYRSQPFMTKSQLMSGLSDSELDELYHLAEGVFATVNGGRGYLTLDGFFKRDSYPESPDRWQFVDRYYANGELVGFHLYAIMVTQFRGKYYTVVNLQLAGLRREWSKHGLSKLLILRIPYIVKSLSRYDAEAFFIANRYSYGLIKDLLHVAKTTDPDLLAHLQRVFKDIFGEGKRKLTVDHVGTYRLLNPVLGASAPTSTMINGIPLSETCDLLTLHMPSLKNLRLYLKALQKIGLHEVFVQQFNELSLVWMEMFSQLKMLETLVDHGLKRLKEPSVRPMAEYHRSLLKRQLLHMTPAQLMQCVAIGIKVKTVFWHRVIPMHQIPIGLSPLEYAKLCFRVAPEAGQVRVLQRPEDNKDYAAWLEGKRSFEIVANKYSRSKKGRQRLFSEPNRRNLRYFATEPEDEPFFDMPYGDIEELYWLKKLPLHLAFMLGTLNIKIIILKELKEVLVHPCATPHFIAYFLNYYSLLRRCHAPFNLMLQAVEVAKSVLDFVKLSWGIIRASKVFFSEQFFDILPIKIMPIKLSAIRDKLYTTALQDGVTGEKFIVPKLSVTLSLALESAWLQSHIIHSTDILTLNTNLLRIGRDSERILPKAVPQIEYNVDEKCWVIAQLSFVVNPDKSLPMESFFVDRGYRGDLSLLRDRLYKYIVEVVFNGISILPKDRSKLPEKWRTDTWKIAEVAPGCAPYSLDKRLTDIVPECQYTSSW